jgi:hypothetical protein
VTHGAQGTRRVVTTVVKKGGSVTQGRLVDLGGVSVVRRQNQAETRSASVTVHWASIKLAT